MSYCVNCGVELAPSERICPLCGTEVHNPVSPWKEPEERPYPYRLEQFAKRVDRKYLGLLLGVLFLIPVVITVLINLITSAEISWSGYIIGAIVVLYVTFVMPLYLKHHRFVFLALLDFAVLLLYLWFIEYISGGKWFFSIALPITLTAAILVLSVGRMLEYKKRPGFLRIIACVLFAAGIMTVAVEIILACADGGGFRLQWSIYPLVPCLLLGVCALIAERRKGLREKVRRRLFF